MTTTAQLIDRVRLELGDAGKSFVTQFVADGTTNRYRLNYSPLEGPTLRVFRNAIDVSDECSVEESTGVLVTDALFDDGDEVVVSGTYYRYFTAAELETFVLTALEQHAARKTDALGRKITIDNLPTLEEYPVALYATTLALYTLATDASFDINIFGPDGVTIPRSERYRQLMDMIQSRKEQYRELCTQLGIGMYSIEVFSLRRISKRTNRYVPVYQPQDYTDRSWPQAADIPIPTYGDQPTPWPTLDKELLAFQGIAFSDTVSFSGDFTGKSFSARILRQRGSVTVVQTFSLVVDEVAAGDFVATLSLSVDQTLRLPDRTWWQVASVDDETGQIIEIKGGNFFTEKSREIIA